MHGPPRPRSSELDRTRPSLLRHSVALSVSAETHDIADVSASHLLTFEVINGRLAGAEYIRIIASRERPMERDEQLDATILCCTVVVVGRTVAICVLVLIACDLSVPPCSFAR